MPPKAGSTLVGYTVLGSHGAARYVVTKDLCVGGSFGTGYLATKEATAPGGPPPCEVFFKELMSNSAEAVERELHAARRHMALQGHVRVARVLDVVERGARAIKAGTSDWRLGGAVVMEMHAGGTLHQRLACPVHSTAAVTPGPRALPEAHARYFFRQLIEGVNYLHSNKMCALRMSATDMTLLAADGCARTAARAATIGTSIPGTCCSRSA